LTKWLNEFAPRKRIINKESMLSILPSSCEKAVLSNRRAAGSNRKVKRVDRNVTHAVLHVVSSWFVPRTCRQLSSGADNLSLTREKELCEWKSVCGNLSIFRHFGSKPIHSFNENPSNFLGGWRVRTTCFGSPVSMEVLADVSYMWVFVFLVLSYFIKYLDS
jgi:hypothetical protein